MRMVFACALILALLSKSTLANSASPLPIEVTQPDGGSLILYMRGTEKLSWYEYVPEAANLQPGAAMLPELARVAATPGYTVVLDAQNRYVYADRGANGQWIPSARVVGRDDPEGQRRLMPAANVMQQMMAQQLPDPQIPSRSAAPIGQVKNLVILLRFADHAARVLPSRQDFETLFNAAAPDPILAPTGSVNAYYKENSYGKMDLQSTVVDWVTLPNSEAYYADGRSGLSIRIREAIRDGLRLVAQDPSVDFSKFDNENGGSGDGWIDSITFVHSGYAAEFGGTAGGAASADRIWSHRWSIGTWTDPSTNVKVSDYNINPGIWGTSGNAIGHIGVICHELGHFFGLPDLYDTSNAGSGIGSWGLMANSWGFDGQQLHPPHFCAWSKIALNWNTAQSITQPGTYSLESTATQGATIYRLDYPSNFGSEYLLIENRQAIGNYEGGIPAGTGGQGGLAIWHIDELVPENNNPGCPGSPGYPANHYKIALIQADGKCHLEKGTNRGDANDLFREGFADTLTSLPHTTPGASSTSYTGEKLLDIKGISSSGPTMQFSYGDPPVLPSSAAFSGSVQIKSPTSHAVNFSNDGLAATLIFDSLDSFAFGSDVSDTVTASFKIPFNDQVTSKKLAIQVRGYISAEASSGGSVMMALNSTHTLFDPRDHVESSPGPSAGKGRFAAMQQAGLAARPTASVDVDFTYATTVTVTDAEHANLTFTLHTNTLASATDSVFLVIDSVDFELAD